MSSTVGTVIIDIKADTAKLVDGMQRAEKAVSKSVDNLKRDIIGVATAFVSIQTAMKAFDIGIDFTKTAMQFEKFGTVLKTIEGSSSKANESMSWISEFTKKTPYELTDVTDSFVKLKAYGIDPTDGTLKTLGDTASAMGKNLNQAVEAMADAVTGENERLKEFGIKASKNAEEITYKWTSASGKAKAITVANNAEIIQSTLESIFNSKYAGAMEQQSKTLEGMLSNIADSYTIFQTQVMNSGLYDYIKALTQVFGEELSDAMSVATRNSATTANSIIDSINATIVATGKLANALQGIGIFFDVTIETLSAVFNAMVVTIIGGAADMIDALNNLPGVNLDNSWSKEISKNAADSFRVNIENINKSLDNVVDYEEKAVSFVDKSAKAMEKFKNAVDYQSENKNRDFGDDAADDAGAISKEVATLQKQWQAESIKIAADTAIAQMGEHNKPYISLMAKYDADIAKYKDVQGAKEILTANYYANLESLNNDAVSNWLKSEFEKSKYIEEMQKADAQKKADLLKAEDDFAKTMQDNYLSMLDTQIALANSTQDWQNGLTGVAGEIMAVSNALGKMNVNELQAKKAQASLDARYTEQFTKYAGDELKTKKLVASYEAEQAAIKDQTRANEINGYANLAGAMSQSFEEGSQGAQAFMAIQQGLALYNAVTAVTGAWASAPFPANIPAVLTTSTAVGALLAQIGTSFGAGAGLFGTTTSTDAFSAQKENLGTGSVLGDASKATESIKESLSLLEDLARPEFRLLSMMNDSLMSIDRALAGTAANISQSGGFAVGEGFTASSSSSSLMGNSTIATGVLLGPIGLGTLLGGELLKNIFGDNMISDFIGGIASFIGGIGGSKTTYSLQDAGINFGAQYIQDAMDDIIGQSFQTVLKSKRTSGFFSSSTKNTISTTFSALDEDIGREFELILSSLYDTVLYATEGLNLATSDIENDLSDFVVNIGKISLKGKTGEQIQQQLTDVFGKIGDELAADALNETLTGFQQIGEGLFETLVRVSGGMQEAEYYIKRLGSSFDAVDYTSILNQQGDVGFEALSQSIITADEATYGLNNGVVQMIETFNASAEELYSVYLTFEQLRLQIEATNQSATSLTSSMLLGAGGADALTSGLSDYIENFLSESEQFSYHSNVLSKEFEKMNLTMPTTIEGFRSIVEGIDTSSEAGQELYGRLITLSGEFSDVFADLTDSLAENVEAIKNQLSDAWLGQYSPLSMLQKTEYANNLAYSPETSGMSAIDASYLALQTAAATATRDEDIALAFSNYTALLEEQVADASRQDIVNVLERVSNTLNDIVDRVERIEQTA